MTITIRHTKQLLERSKTLPCTTNHKADTKASRDEGKVFSNLIWSAMMEEFPCAMLAKGPKNELLIFAKQGCLINWKICPPPSGQGIGQCDLEGKYEKGITKKWETKN